MIISKHFFHVLSLVLFLSFSFSFAHFHDVTPYKEFDSKSSNSFSSAPSPSPASFDSSKNVKSYGPSASGPDGSSFYSGSGSFMSSGSYEGSCSHKDSNSFKGTSSFKGSANSGESGSRNCESSGSSKNSDSSSGSGASNSSTSSDSLSGSNNSKGSGSSKTSGSSSDFGVSSSSTRSGSSSGSSNFKGFGSSKTSDSSSGSGASGSSTYSSFLSGSNNFKGSDSSKTSDFSSDSGTSAFFTGSDSLSGSSNLEGSQSSKTSDSLSNSDASGSSKRSGSSPNSGASGSSTDSSTNSVGSASSTGSTASGGSSTSIGSSTNYGPTASGLTNSGSATGTGSFAAPDLTNSGSSTSNAGGLKSSGSSTGTRSFDASGSTAFGSPAGFGTSAGSDSSMTAGSDSSTSPNASGSEENNNEINPEIKISGSFPKVFAFGDSYTDTGNAQLLGIVKNFVGAPLKRVFQGINSNFKSGSGSSNGRLVVDFLCDALNISSLQPYKAVTANFDINGNSGVNFAVGGATSLSGDFFVNHKIGHTLLWKGIPLGFQTQIEWFNQFLTEIACKGMSEEECKAEMGTNLIWLGQMGVDDFARSIGSSISLRWLTDITLGHLSKILTTVLDSGAKFVVVQGLPPVGCCPLAKFLIPQFAKDEMGCSAVLNRAVMAHNELLQKTLEEFQRKHGSDVTIAYADYYNAFKTIMGNLAGFGFSDGSQACCGVGGGLLNFNLHNLCGMPGTTACNNPAGLVHWDGLHLTEAMHRQITSLLLHKGFCKPSFAHIISRYRSLLKLLVH